MKKITLLLTLCLIVLLPVTYGQCNGNLSSKGYAHIKAAQTLTDMATTTSDWKDVAIEYEQVIVSDPDYAPVYMILGDLYTKIGNEEGVEAFNMAEYYYNGCKMACADSADAIEVKLTILNALKRKYCNGPNRFVGTWGTWDNGKFNPEIEISYVGDCYSFKIIDDWFLKRNIKVEEKTATEIIFSFTSVEDSREELRRKGWTHYYGECNNHADFGYHKSGKYEYNIKNTLSQYSYAIEGDNVVRKRLMYHCDYYIDNQKTYAETEYYRDYNRTLTKWER